MTTLNRLDLLNATEKQEINCCIRMTNGWVLADRINY